MASRRLAAVLLGCLLAACGGGEPMWKQRTAPDWVEQLWDPVAESQMAAYEALVGMAQDRPEPVLAALEKAMRQPPPAPIGSPFTLVVDADAAKRAGLDAIDPGTAAGDALPVVRQRLTALKLIPTSIKSSTDGEIDLVAPGGRTRAEIERAQVVLSTRGALDLRGILRPPGVAGRGPAYDGPVPWAELLAAEGRLLAAAHGTGDAYRPSDPRWRLVLPGGSEDPVLVEEPKTPEDAIDERVVASAEGRLDPSGAPVVVVQVKSERRADVERFLTRWAGARVAVLADGEIRARIRPALGNGATLEIPTGPPPEGVTPIAWAREHAVIWSSGRIPRPLRAVPLSPGFLGDPRPDNAFARVAVGIGERSRPMLVRLKADGPRWAKASATWALEQMGGS